MADDQKRRHRRPAAEFVTAATPLWCPGCQRERPASDFNREARKFSGRAGRCRECQAAWRKTAAGVAATQLRNQRRWSDPAYRSKSREWQRNRRKRLGATHDLRRARRRLKQIVDDWKVEGCADCGVEDIRLIDPDHVYGVKTANVSRMVQLCVSERRLREELARCVRRCANCHRVKTAGERLSVLRDGRRSPRSWRRRIEYQDRNDAIKLGIGCADCGYRDHARALDWDHARGDKVASVATLIANGRPWAEIVSEIRKCVLRCANCHRLVTHARSAKIAAPTS